MIYDLSRLLDSVWGLTYSLSACQYYSMFGVRCTFESFERNQSELISSGVLLTLPLLFPQLFNLRRRPIDDQHGRFNKTGFGIFYWFIALISSYCSELPVELFLNNKASGRRFLLVRGLLAELVVMRGILGFAKN